MPSRNGCHSGMRSLPARGSRARRADRMQAGTQTRAKVRCACRVSSVAPSACAGDARFALRRGSAPRDPQPISERLTADRGRASLVIIASLMSLSGQRGLVTRDPSVAERRAGQRASAPQSERPALPLARCEQRRVTTSVCQCGDPVPAPAASVDPPTGHLGRTGALLQTTGVASSPRGRGRRFIISREDKE